MIGGFTPAEVSQVARLHCATVRSLLGELGEQAARAFYTGGLRSGLAVGYVDWDVGAVTGFVFGSAHPDRLRRAAARHNPLDTAAGLALGVLRRPGTLLSLLKSLRGPDAGDYDQGAAELIYLGVTERQRGGGLGRRLVEAFGDELRRRGVPRYELSVDQDNAAAIAFYERLGFRQVGEYREFGVQHRRYRRELGRPEGR